MNIPCRLRAKRHFQPSTVNRHSKLKMSPGDYAEVTVEQEKTSSNYYRAVRVTCRDTHSIYTEKALENAIERGDFEYS
jgi:hypothetical protein